MAFGADIVVGAPLAFEQQDVAVIGVVIGGLLVAALIEITLLFADFRIKTLRADALEQRRSRNTDRLLALSAGKDQAKGQ